MVEHGRRIRYREIADELRRQIAAGELAVGAVLPSEAELAARHLVSRVTVRKALEVLRDEDRVDSRQGYGWFVAGPTLHQSLGNLSTIEDQLAEQGRALLRKVLDFSFDTVDGADVAVVTRLDLADGQPFALVMVWFPAELGSSLSRHDVESATFHDLLEVDVDRAVQTIGAAVADDRDVDLLHVPTGSPVLVVERVSYDIDDRAVLRSQHRFPAQRTEFVVEVSVDDSAEAWPPRLRLLG